MRLPAGMAAIYALVKPRSHAGDHLICSHNVYGGTQRLFQPDHSALWN